MNIQELTFLQVQELIDRQRDEIEKLQNDICIYQNMLNVTYTEEQKSALWEKYLLEQMNSQNEDYDLEYYYRNR